MPGCFRNHPRSTILYGSVAEGMNLGWTKPGEKPALRLQLGSLIEPLKGGPSTKTGKFRWKHAWLQLWLSQVLWADWLAGWLAVLLGILITQLTPSWLSSCSTIIFSKKAMPCLWFPYSLFMPVYMLSLIWHLSMCPISWQHPDWQL